MSAKKCCCCGLLSCFPCFSDKKSTLSAQPDSSEIDPPPRTVITNPSPVATLTIESSHQLSSSAPPHQLSSSAPPSAAAPSQVNASTVMQNDSQPIAPSDAVPSSSRGIVTPSALIPTTSQTTASPPTQPPSSSTPSSLIPATSQTTASPPTQPASSSTPSSSRLPKESDYAETIMEAAKELDKENVDGDFSDLISYISRLFDFIEEKKKGENQSMPKAPVGSKTFLRLKEVVSEGVNAVKDIVTTDGKTFLMGFLKGMGMAHMVTTGFLVAASILERHEAVSANKEACLYLLKEMNILAHHVQQLQQRPKLKKGMEAPIREATMLIVEASIDCCTQIGASKFSRFISTTVNGEALAKFQKKFEDTHTHMQAEMDVINQIDMRLRKGHELIYPEYPNGAVGIEDPLREVIERLEMRSDKNAVAVIVHGFGGMGKTILADAVFARLLNAEIEGYKYSYVRLFDTIASTPNIVELQKFIIKALKMGEDPKYEVQRYEEGQLKIESILEKEVVFIYIDNVLIRDEFQERGDALEQLLPKNMGNAKKLRLLITARNRDAEGIIVRKKVKTECYAIQSLPEARAAELFKNALGDKLKQLDHCQIDELVQICGGVPKILTVVAGFISSEENTLNAYRTVINESKRNWKGKIGEDINFYVFAYENLHQTLQDPFLDICSFFEGWDWKTLSNIVGESELESLEKRGLVTKHAKGMTAKVPDVILAIGLQKTEGQRFRLTSANDIQEFLDQPAEDLQKIKGIWASDNKDPLCIPASKLDLMSGSLRVLKLGPLADVKGKCKNTFKELAFFSARTSHLPFDLSKLERFKNLRHLCYNPEDLQNLLQMPFSLGHIEFQLNSPLFQISSNCIRQLEPSNLRVLKLANAQFESLPQELGDLGNSLEELSFSGCKYLKEVPASISRLGSLRVLRMDDCFGLTQLPEGLGSLNSLQELYLYGCKSLEALPSELENLTSLQKLDLSWCRSLEALPSRLGNLTSLQELTLNYCKSLQALPTSLEELSSLRSLHLSHCRGIKDLPCGLEKLTSLVELTLYFCGLSSIPENIGMLKLNSINLDSAPLKDLPDGFCNFSTLTELDMTDCDRLEKLPKQFGEVTSLRKLIMTSCRSLQKLPESFNQLKYLEHLDLSECSTLEELCKEFEGLSLLRVLSLQQCDKLKKLPEDFQSLTSLEVLDVRNCHKLEGKWINSMLKMEKLQILRIAGSKLLEERWEKIQAQQCNQSWSCAVYTEQGFSNEENLLKQLQSKCDSMLTNGAGKPMNISRGPVNTLLLVMFDAQQEFYPRSFPFPLLEKSIEDIQTDFEMVYFGNHWDQLPKKVADRIMGYARANRDAKALFQKLLSLVVHYQTDFDWYLTGSFQMTAEIVTGEKGDKYLSRWKFFGHGSDEEKMLEDFVVTKCGRYLQLKQLAERPRGSRIALLTELFLREEEEISLPFLKNKDGESTQVGVDELKGKTILLDIRPANICYAIPLQALVEMYVEGKEKFGFEIITIPLMQENTKWDVSVEFAREVPWLVLQNPWRLTNVTKYFLLEGCPRWPEGWNGWYPNTMRIIESDGTIAPYRYPGVLCMVNTWGAAAYPFTAEKEEELIQKEKTEMEAMSHAMFLFQHLERVAEQLREATRQQKMIWLCSCHEKEFTNSMKDVLTELSDIIYIIYIPNFHEAGGGLKFGYFTATIWKPSKMSSAEMGRIFSLSLTEYEAIRFWARIRSLKVEIKATDKIQLSKMLFSMISDNDNPYSWMFIMNEDGNLITTKGKEIVKLLSEKYSDDRVKQLMQQLLIGTRRSWKKTLLELEEMLSIDGEDNEGYGDDDDVDSESIDGEDNEGYGDDDDVDSEGQ